jgi:hypothetical protein
MTTFVEGLVLLLWPQLDSAAVDGWAAVFVCTLIFIFGVLHGAHQWVRQCWTYCMARRQDSTEMLL